MAAASGSYYDYPPDQYAPGSPDTFFANVNIQPPTEDSEQTPPSPVSKSRRSVARPSQAHSNSVTSQSRKRSSSSRGPSSQVRKERERQLANRPRESLIDLAIVKEHDAREAKHLLTSAILQIESLRDRLRREEETRKSLEEETRVLGMKTTKAILDAQKETLNAKEEIGTYKLKLESLERELKRARDVIRIVEKERDEADKALVRARTTARTLKEQNILLHAQEEGRRLGFEEGLRQGRLLQEAMPLEPEPLDEPEPRPKDRKHSIDSDPSSSKQTSRRHARKSSNPSHETEAAIAALNKIHESETFRIRSQLSKIEADLDRTIQEKRDAEKERRELLEFKQRMEADMRRYEVEREKERRAIKELEREKEELRRKDSERVRRIKEEHRRVEEERERELRELKKEKERLEREKADLDAKARDEIERERERLKKAEEELEREKEREREREKESREGTTAAITAAVTAAIEATNSHISSPDVPPFKSQEHQRLPYVPVPPPPIDAMPTPITMPVPTTTTPGPFGVPLTNSVGSQRGHKRRDSFSSNGSTAQYDMLQPPTGRERGLGVIPEDASVHAPSPSHIVPASMSMPSVPDWANAGNNDGWRSRTPGWQTNPLPPSRGPDSAVSGGAPQWPEPSVPNIIDGLPSNSGPQWPEPSVPNISGLPLSSSGGEAHFPEPSIPNIVPGRPASRAAQFPEPAVPNIVPSRSGGPTAQFPEPVVPNIVGRPSSRAGGAQFPEPSVPNILPSRPASRAAQFPEPSVPNIVPSRGGGPAAQFPEPVVPDIVGRAPSRNGGALFPEPTIPNIMGRSPSQSGGAQFPEPTIPSIVGRPPSRGGGSTQFPEPTVPNIVGRPPSRNAGGAQFPQPTIPNVIGRSPSRAGSATPGWPEPSVPSASENPSSRMSGVGPGPGWPSPGVPNITGRDGGRGMGAGSHASPYTNPNFLAPSNPNPLMRRSSSGSTSSYEIRIEPPSRPASGANIGEDDGTGHWLSPNHSPIPLPIAPRGPPTQPSSPVVLPGPMPANFVPQKFTDRNGVSTPIWQANTLPGMSAPVIPGVTTSTGSQKYGNPLHKDKDDDGPPVFPRSPKSPNRRLSSTPAPAPWGSAGRAGSLGGGGLTPATSSRDLPGVGGGNRTSIFGGVMSSPAIGATLQMPEPTVPFIPPAADEIEEDNGFDQTTVQNTMLNATIGKKGATGKKKKKR